MKNLKLMAAVSAFILSACSAIYEPITPQDTESTTSTQPTEEQTAPDNNESITPAESVSVLITENRITEEFSISSDRAQKLVGIIKEMAGKPPLELPYPSQQGGMDIVISGSEESLYINRNCDGYNDFVSINSSAFPVSEEFDEFVSELRENTPEKRLIGTSCKYPEPTDDTERLRAAEYTVATWLETLKNEQGRWHIDDYFISEPMYGAPQVTAKSEDGKIFAAVVWFGDSTNVGGFPGESVFARYNDSDFVNKEEHQPGVYGLFRYENGECTIIDYVNINEYPNGYKFGLNSKKHEYLSFYEFAADKENTARLLEEHPYKSSTVDSVLSHTVMQLADGEICFLAIGTMDDDFTVKNNGKIGGPMKQEFYTMQTTSGYNSPVYYDEANRQPGWIEYSEKFDLVLDDYNSDGNPDFAIKVGGDENGSVYYLHCMDYGFSEIASRGEFYLPDRFEDSLRMQIIGDKRIALPVKIDGKIEMQSFYIFGKDGTGKKEPLDNYRLYSQKFYLPDNCNYYESGTKTIIFNAWNNTAEAVDFGGAYTIERKNGSNWEEVLKGGCKPETVQPFNCAEIVVDTSKLTAESREEYRLCMTINGEKVYGGFYLGGGNVPAELKITGEAPLPDNRKELKFTVENIGKASLYPIGAELYFNNEKLLDVDVKQLRGLQSGHSATVTVKCGEKPFTAGSYELKIHTESGVFSAKQTLISIPENKRYPLELVSVQATEEGIAVELQANQQIINASCMIAVLSENEWVPAALLPEEYKEIKNIYDNVELKPFSLKSGEKITLNFISLDKTELPDEINTLMTEATTGVKSGDRCAVVTVVDGKELWLYFTMT